MKDGVEPKLPTPPPLEDDGLTPDQREERRRLEYGEEEAGLFSGDEEVGHQEQITTTHEERIAQVPLVNYSVPAGGKVWHAKLPNFLRLETTAWSQDTWRPEDEEAQAEEDAMQSQDASQGEDVKPKIGRNKSHLPDENVIRWRWTKDELGEYVSSSLDSISSSSLLTPVARSVDQTIERTRRPVVRRFPLSPSRCRTLRHLSRPRSFRKHVSRPEPRRSFFLPNRTHPNNVRPEPRSRSHVPHCSTRVQQDV